VNHPGAGRQFQDGSKPDGRERRKTPAKQIPNMTSKLYVGNLPFAITARELKELFTESGAVSGVDLAFDHFTGRARGFAFVDMATPDDARRVIARFHGYDIGGRSLTVNEADDQG
jgi:RNA recognition motif-containing protein